MENPGWICIPFRNNNNHNMVHLLRRIVMLILVTMISLCSAAGRKQHPVVLRGGRVTTTQVADPVNVVVLTESLCPGCEQFIRTTLTDAYTRLGPLVMNLTVIPFGNAHFYDGKPNPQVTCQHGLGECDANVWELCAIHVYPKVDQYLPFLECLTHKLRPGYDNSTICPCVFEGCASSSHLWFPALKDCHANLYWEMLRSAAQATPPHDHVPWVILDGKHVDENDEDSGFDFIRAVCRVFQSKGGSHPSCSGELTRTRGKQEPIQTTNVCQNTLEVIPSNVVEEAGNTVE